VFTQKPAARNAPRSPALVCGRITVVGLNFIFRCLDFGVSWSWPSSEARPKIVPARSFHIKSICRSGTDEDSADLDFFQHFHAAFNTFTQRVFTDLIGAGHEVSVELPFSLDAMREAVDQFESDLILCPFLKQIVPEDIWKTHLTIIMHPGIKGDRGPSSIDWAIMENSREWGVAALEADAETDVGDIWSTNTFKLPLATKSSGGGR
jgi:hypothetical protein